MPLCVKVTLQDLSSAVGRFWWHHLTDPYAERRQHLEDFQQILSTCIIENNFGWEMDWKFIDWLTNQKLPSWWPRSFEWRNQRIKLWTIRRPSLSALGDTYRTFKQFFFSRSNEIFGRFITVIRPLSAWNFSIIRGYSWRCGWMSEQQVRTCRMPSKKRT